MSKNFFEGRAAIVTGGAQGFGYAVAQRLLAKGARVALWDADAEMLGIAHDALRQSGEIVPVLCDVSIFDEVEAATVQTEKQFKNLDILVHSAGIAGLISPLVDYPLSEWQRIIDVNLNGSFYVNQTVVKRMISQGYGRILNIASVAGKEGNPNACAYSASKAGLIALTKSLGKETAKLDIAVNVITPSAARTKILDQLTPEFVNFMLGKIPRARFLEVEELASMVEWLVSRENSFSTGAVFDISGGRSTY